MPLRSTGLVAVERGDRLAARAVVAACLELGDQFVDDVVLDDLAVGRGIAIVIVVKIELAHLQRILAERARDIIDDVFDRERALRAAETAKRGIRLGIGLDAVGVDGDVAEVIGIVEMAHRARDHRPGQVGRKTGLRGHVDFGRVDQTVVVVTDLVVEFETVALAGDHHVVVAVEPQLDRAPSF